MAVLRCCALIILGLISFVFSDPIVTLPKGKIRGKTLLSVNNKTINAFLGIPFAKPPLGELRFKAPEEPESWSGILNTTKDTNKICYTSKSDSASETEDCLYLNVITPVVNLNSSDEKLPVLLSIYGGAFRTGSASYGNHSADWWVEENIIFVNFNYRLGPFGFISTGDLVLPGNYGLKDQYFALKWTYENIHLFGGDKDKITVQGQSAGGASVTYQILHKNSGGMFRAGIAESGSAFSFWAHLGKPKNYAINLISTMNDGSPPSDNSSTFIYHFLLNATAKEIDRASQNMGAALALPTIEPEHEGAFITQSQYTLMESGEFNQVPLIIGINSEEDIYKANVPNCGIVSCFGISGTPLELVEAAKNVTMNLLPNKSVENGRKKYSSTGMSVAQQRQEILEYLFLKSKNVSRIDLEVFKATAKSYSEDPTLLVPASLGDLSPDNRTIVGQAVKDLYIGQGNNFSENLGALVGYFSDTSFTRPGTRFAELHSQHAPVWFYQFSHKGRMGGQNNIELPGAELVAHSEEVHYYTVTRKANFDNTQYDTFPESDVLTHFRIVELWANFIKYLDPTPVSSDILSNITWPAITSNNFTFLNINDTLEVRSNPKSPRFAGWKKIFDTYGIKPFVTY